MWLNILVNKNQQKPVCVELNWTNGVLSLRTSESINFLLNVGMQFQIMVTNETLLDGISLGECLVYKATYIENSMRIPIVRQRCTEIHLQTVDGSPRQKSFFLVSQDSLFVYELSGFYDTNQWKQKPCIEITNWSLESRG